MWLVGEEEVTLSSEPYSLNGGTPQGESFDLFALHIEEFATPPAALDWSFAGAAPSTDPNYVDIVYVFTGEAASGWLINGEAFPDVTIEELALGSEAIIEVRNLSPSDHPFHLHGHEFEVLSIDGTPPATKTLEDTVNVRIGETLRIKLIADNPGDWMAHCHILPHAHGGMMTVLRVLDE